MFLAIRELWRSKLKFGLLSAAVGLLVFLLLFLGTLSGTLLSSYIGAIDNATADLLVFSDDSRRNVQASRLTPEDVDVAREAAGVTDAAGLSEATLTVRIEGESADLSLWGTTPGGPGDVPVIEGRPASSGEVVVDVSAKGEGIVIGSVLDLVETQRQLRVVGYTENRQYSVLPTGYTPQQEWDGIFRATFPGAPTTPLNIIAIEIDGDADAQTVISGIDDTLVNADSTTPSEAAESAPGVSSISTSFNLIVGITFGIVVVVIGFFFTILAVQKRKSFVMLRAVGSSRRYLGWSVLLQIIVTMVLGTLFGYVFLWGATFASSESFPLTINVAGIAVTSIAVLIASVIAGAFSLRRALAVDPAQAAVGAP
jgi:putative ABC transport system permease protein